MVGLTIHDPRQAYQGYTLYCQSFPTYRREGEPPHPIYLVDMEGTIVHKWDVELSLQSHCRLLADGNLIYPTHDRSDVDRAQVGLTEVDPQSQVVWRYRCRADHDNQLLGNGNLLIHTITENVWPALGPELKRHPYMIEVTRDKELVWEWKGEEHLAELEALLPPESWRFLMERATGEFAFDWAHNNTLQVIPDNATYRAELDAGVERPRFAPGNIVFSYRSVDVIGVIEKATGEIVWAWGPGTIDGQHKPHMLPTGHILLFDNGTLRGFSRVIELDPLSGEIAWEYVADPPESFLSRYISGAQRLPNGNTLICEGANSRFFEVTPEGETVWEFVNPYDTPTSLHSVYRCLRYSPEYVRPLLERAG
jgi:hypothetical protein